MNSRNITFLVVGLILGIALGSLALRALNPSSPDNPSSQSLAAAKPAGGGTQEAIYGPSLESIRAATARVESWIAANRVHPTRAGVAGFRNYALEVRSWYVLYAFERDPAKKERYAGKVREAIGRLRQGEELVAVLESTPARKYIADLLIVMQAAREVGSKVPALEKVLPELIERGLDAPNRPVGLQIPLAWLIRTVGSDQGPGVNDLRARGMLAAARSEVGMVELEVYILTHEIFGLSDYGLRRERFTTSEQAYLDRTLPFWTLFSAVMHDPDLGAELAICHQVAGMTDEYAYGQSMGFLVASQSPEGFFQKQKPAAQAVDHMHTSFVGLHALLGHESLAAGYPLPLDR